jgi:dihydrodipicolinate synthase/N-acetylneuraminate lyase
VENYDGLTLTQAIRLCTKRHEDLTSSDIKFIGKVGVAEALKPAEALRLSALVRKLRQGDLIAQINTGSVREARETAA